MTQKSLPLGTSTFSALRQSNEIYVDKTDLIYSLVGKGRGKLFLARPRRFGKSLLISTFESLFKFGVRDFKGLAIEKLWTDKTYNVVRLDFSGLKKFQSAEQFEVAFQSFVITSFAPLGFKYDPSQQLVLFLDQFKSWLSSLAPSSLVLLIDEYDAPLTAHLNNRETFNIIRDVLGDFYATLKQFEGCLRFFFMTGITKFSNTSIFSAFNNLQDISLIPAYGTLLGYTENEILQYFAPYLLKACKALNLDESELIDQLRDHYDGFSFDAMAQTHVYCPWSVLNFFAHPELGFQNYWYESGGQPTVLMKYLNTHALANPRQYDQPIAVNIDVLKASRQYEEISLEALLTQSGYLTIKELLVSGVVQLGYPNKEVSSSMARLYADELLKIDNRLQSGVPLLSKVLASGTVEMIVEYFNKAVNAIDYHRYPIIDEATCRAYLQVLLIGAAMMPKVETHTALGRSDLEVEAGDRHWFFEFKYAKQSSQVETLLHDGIEQVQTRNYGETLHGRKLCKVIMVFSDVEKQFVAWEHVKTP